MIIRITNDGQYRVTTDEARFLSELDEVDDRIVELLERTEKEFHDLMSQLLDIAHKNSEKLPPESLEPSEYVLPPQDLSVFEGYQIFKGEGIVA
ncbi:MAG: hypothetical protein C4521_01115 [Actinobacteria bacterium]|nr:MAG: hypothetical protein C4521_01115 [Actinomycetota bacterium]